MASEGRFSSTSKGTTRFDQSVGRLGSAIARDYGAQMRAQRIVSGFEDYQLAMQTRATGIEQAARRDVQQANQQSRALQQSQQSIQRDQRELARLRQDYDRNMRQWERAESSSAYQRHQRRAEDLMLRIRHMTRQNRRDVRGYRQQSQAYQRSNVGRAANLRATTGAPAAIDYINAELARRQSNVRRRLANLW